MKVGFIGLGKLGLPVAEVMATKHEVMGYDIVPRDSKSVIICDSIEKVVEDREIIFIAVPTPHAPEYDGSHSVKGLELKDFDYSAVKECLSAIDPFLKKQQLVVLISTVLPGTLRRELASCLKNADLVYNPYLIAMGTEQWDFINPEMIIIGTRDGSRAERLIDFYSTIVRIDSRYATGTWEEAEAIKIFYNTFISMKLSLVNMVQDVAMKIGNMNVDVVTGALAASRQRIISPAYMLAGMGDGGPCHPRDNIALRWLSRDLDLGYDLFEAVISSRESQARNLARFLLSQGNQVTILGRTYKPGVGITTGSYSVLVGKMIEELGGEFEFYDPATMDIESRFTASHVYLVSFIEDWISSFRFVPGSIVVDPWRRFRTNAPVTVIPYGNTRTRQFDPVKYENIDHGF